MFYISLILQALPNITGKIVLWWLVSLTVLMVALQIHGRGVGLGIGFADNYVVATLVIVMLVYNKLLAFVHINTPIVYKYVKPNDQLEPTKQTTGYSVKKKRFRLFSMTTIRSRLQVGFVLMAMIPAIGISVGSIVLGYYNGQKQTQDRLQSVAALKESEIDFWLASLRNELVAPMNPEFAQDRPRIVLFLARNHIYYDFYHKATRRHFSKYIDQADQLQELFLLDVQGQVVLSTDLEHEGLDYSNQPFFQQGLIAPTVQPPFYSFYPEDNHEDNHSLITAIPIYGDDREVLGVMASRSSVERIGEILGEHTGLGATGRSYLVNRNYNLLLDTQFDSASDDLPSNEGHTVHSIGINAAIQDMDKGFGIYEDYRGVQIVGVYRWIPELKMALLVEQEASEVFQSILTNLTVNLVIVSIAVILALGASLVITRSIATPLVELAETATQMAAGDLQREVRVERDDEVGALASAFNIMTVQLRDLIGHLEERVRDRTRALRRRALQLETSAQVSRDLSASILDVDDLLTRVAKLIKDAFDYYQVQIYLIDHDIQRLVLRANGGEADSAVHYLEINDSSLNGTVAVSGEAVLVNNVAEDTRFLVDDSLPDTHSELVVPLSVSDRMLGTLDVQSTDVNAFAEDDVLVIQSLGDQIAVAVENARLVRHSRELAVVHERNRMARELHDSMTQQLYSLILFSGACRKATQAVNLERAERHLVRVEQSAQQALKEMRLLVYELRPQALDEVGLVGALQQRLDAVENRVGITTQLLVEGELDLPTATEEGLYRIAQEALTNALKHAFASSILIKIKARKQTVSLEVVDDGCGFEPGDCAELGGLGLVIMRERAEELGGTLSIDSESGKETCVKVTIKRKRKRNDG